MSKKKRDLSRDEADADSQMNGAVGGTRAEQWNRIAEKVEEKIRRDGPWASAKLESFVDRRGR